SADKCVSAVGADERPSIPLPELLLGRPARVQRCAGEYAARGAALFDRPQLDQPFQSAGSAFQPRRPPVWKLLRQLRPQVPVRLRLPLLSHTAGELLPIQSTLQDLARDDQALNFAGAFADGAELDVAVKLLGRIVLDKSVAAMNLHPFVGAPHCDLAGI